MGNFTKILIAAGLSIAFAGILYSETSKMVFAGYLLPRMLSGVIILLALGMIFETWWCQRKSTGSAGAVPDNIDVKKAAAFIGLIVAYILGINFIGYFIATPLYIFAAFAYLKSMNRRNTAMVAVLFTAFVYLLFVSFLQLPIPLGPME